MNEKLNLDFFRQVFENYIPFNKLLGIQLEEVRKGYARIRLPFKEELIGEVRDKRMHGGAIMAAMDSVAGAASFTTIHMKYDKLATIDLRTDFLSPVGPEDVIIEAEVKKSGNRVIFIAMKAFHPSKPEVILSEGRAAFSVKREKPSEEVKVPG